MKGKKLLIFVILSVIIIGAVIVSCTMIGPDPNFEITLSTPYAFTVSSTTTSLKIDTIRILNKCPLDLRITRMHTEYLRNTTVLYTSENQNYSIFIPAFTHAMDTLGDSSYVELIDHIVEFPSSVYNSMVNNDWENVTLRLYFTVEDDNGYGKTLTKYINFTVFQ